MGTGLTCSGKRPVTETELDIDIWVESTSLKGPHVMLANTYGKKHLPHWEPYIEY